jgi:hypothetical protein
MAVDSKYGKRLARRASFLAALYARTNTINLQTPRLNCGSLTMKHHEARLAIILARAGLPWEGKQIQRAGSRCNAFGSGGPFSCSCLHLLFRNMVRLMRLGVLDALFCSRRLFNLFKEICHVHTA